jgi:hypothetical protein
MLEFEAIRKFMALLLEFSSAIEIDSQQESQIERKRRLKI